MPVYPGLPKAAVLRAFPGVYIPVGVAVGTAAGIAVEDTAVGAAAGMVVVEVVAGTAAEAVADMVAEAVAGMVAEAVVGMVAEVAGDTAVELEVDPVELARLPAVGRKRRSMALRLDSGSRNCCKKPFVFSSSFIFQNDKCRSVYKASALIDNCFEQIKNVCYPAEIRVYSVGNISGVFVKIV